MTSPSPKSVNASKKLKAAFLTASTSMKVNMIAGFAVGNGMSQEIKKQISFLFGRGAARSLFLCDEDSVLLLALCYSLLGLSRMARILYVSDCIFFPSKLTAHSNFALSP